MEVWEGGDAAKQRGRLLGSYFLQKVLETALRAGPEGREKGAVGKAKMLKTATRKRYHKQIRRR